MDDEGFRCTNHPGRPTRVRCSACDAPICVDCMRESAVGIKCPACARVSRRARRVGRPRHYLLGAGAGLAVAAILGAVIALFPLPLFGFLLLAVVGLAVAAAVERAARVRHPAVSAIAAGATLAGLALGSLAAGLPAGALATPGWIFGALIAAGVAALRAGR